MRKNIGNTQGQLLSCLEILLSGKNVMWVVPTQREVVRRSGMVDQVIQALELQGSVSRQMLNRFVMGDEFYFDIYSAGMGSDNLSQKFRGRKGVIIK